MIDTGFRNLDSDVDGTLDGSIRFDRPHSAPTRSTDEIGSYLNDIGRYPLLTAAEEKTLTRRIRAARLRYRHAMLRDIHVLGKVAELLIRIGLGEQRIDRCMEVAVGDLNEKRRLVAVAHANGKTLRGMVAETQNESDPYCRELRLNRATRLVDETKLKTREVETIYHETGTARDAATAALKAYESLRNRMVAANLRLAVSVARKFQGRGLPFLDLVQEASTGLFRAVDKFDPERGLKFSTYAVWWAKQAVRSALSAKARLMRLNPTAMQRVRELQHRADDIQQRTEKSANLDDLAQSVGLPRRELQHYWNARNLVASLDRPIDSGSDETFSDSVEDHRCRNVMEGLIQADERRRIRRAISGLEPREREVIRWRFGLKDGVYRNLAEVGRKMSLTRERIRQIEKVSLEKLRGRLGNTDAAKDTNGEPS